jgi:hypothetical protein
LGEIETLEQEQDVEVAAPRGKNWSVGAKENMGRKKKSTGLPGMTFPMSKLGSKDKSSRKSRTDATAVKVSSPVAMPYGVPFVAVREGKGDGDSSTIAEVTEKEREDNARAIGSAKGSPTLGVGGRRSGSWNGLGQRRDVDEPDALPELNVGIEGAETSVSRPKVRGRKSFMGLFGR